MEIESQKNPVLTEAELSILQEELQIEVERISQDPEWAWQEQNFEEYVGKDTISAMTEQPVVKELIKGEWFHSGNLLMILEYFRMCLATGNEQVDDETNRNHFWSLRHYGLSADLRGNKCQISYICSLSSRASKIGRVYGYSTSLYQKNKKRHIGLQNMPRWIRSALASSFYWDIDVVNAHQSLLLGILEMLQATEETKTKYLRCLVLHRDEIIKEIWSMSPLSGLGDSDDAIIKRLITSLFYGGFVESAWKVLGLPAPASTSEDISALNKSFSLRGFSKEMVQIGSFLYEDPLLEKHFDYLKDLKTHERIFGFEENTRKRNSRLLSLFLQTEERKLLAKIEKFMNKNNRVMDCYIHDGGLIRKLACPKKQVKSSSAIFSALLRKKENKEVDEAGELSNFEPNQAFSIDQYADYNWETYFPPELLRNCEKYLFVQSPIMYAHIRLSIKAFDSNWVQHIKLSIPFVPTTLRKTYSELKYYYETHHNLFQLSEDGHWMFDGNTYTMDIIPTILPEKQFSHDIIWPMLAKNKATTSKQTSLSPVRSPQSIKSPTNTEDDENKLFSPCMELGGNFWSIYLQEAIQSVDKVLFCWDELNLSQTKKPTDNLKNKKVARKYVVLYENYESFDVMKDGYVCNCLFEAFLDNEADKDEKSDRFIQHNDSPSHGDANDDLGTIMKLFPLANELEQYHLRHSWHFLGHLYMLCDKREEEFIYVVKYVARILQKPNVKEEGCGLILYSALEGVGKSVAASMILDLLAPFSKETHMASDVFGQFGVMQENCMLLHFEDTNATEMKQFASHFKNRITAKTLTVERKHENKQTRMNLCRYLITTNNLNSLPLGEYDRRWAVISCSSLLLGQNEYFSKLNSAWSSLEVRRSTFMFLYLISLGDFSCERNKPETSLIKELRSQKMSSIKRFMIGLSLWIEENIKSRLTEEGSKFRKEYERKVYLKEKNTQNALKKAFWINTQDLFTFFEQWCKCGSYMTEIPCTLLTFSKEVRRSLFPVTSQNDSQGLASLPICVAEWVREAQKYDMNSSEGMIQLDSLLKTIADPQSTPKPDKKKMNSRSVKKILQCAADEKKDRQIGIKKIFIQDSKKDEIQTKPTTEGFIDLNFPSPRVDFNSNSFGGKPSEFRLPNEEKSQVYISEDQSPYWEITNNKSKQIEDRGSDDKNYVVSFDE